MGRDVERDGAGIFSPYMRTIRVLNKDKKKPLSKPLVLSRAVRHEAGHRHCGHQESCRPGDEKFPEIFPRLGSGVHKPGQEAVFQKLAFIHGL